MKEQENLTTKRITEFTPEDSIYITDSSSFNSRTYLCSFISFEKNRVTGKIIKKNHAHERDIDTTGRVISAPLSKCCLYGQSELSGNARTSYHWFDSLGYALNPMDLKKNTENPHIPDHESYGMIGLSKRNSRGTHLFGTSIQHNQTIRITIHTAEHQRSLNKDRFYAKKELIEVEISENQFAQLITSANQGDGIPCTIRHVDYKRMANPPFQTKQETFEKELQKEMDNYVVDLEKTMANTREILKKPAIGKGDRDLIEKDINRLYKFISDSLPFMHTQFREQMDDVVSEAKIGIEAFAEDTIRRKGLQALAESDPQMKEIILQLQGKANPEQK